MNYCSTFSLIKQVFVAAAIVGFLLGCKKNTDISASVDCSGPAKSFAADINPTIQSSCSFDSDCHGSGSTSGPGSLLTYSQIFNARSAMRLAVASGNMPKDKTLPASEKNAILCWLDNGAANN